MVQPIIKSMVQKMWMTKNPAKRRRDGEEPCVEDRDLEVFSNNTHKVNYEK